MSKAEINRCEFWVSANRIVTQSNKHNFEQEKIQVNHRRDFRAFEEMLEGYHNMKILQYLKYGFPLNSYNTEVNEEMPCNQAGARAHPEEVSKYI